MVSKHWSKPKLQAQKLGEPERHATWMELFYDLAFVVVIATLAHDFSHHLQDGIWKFILLFAIVYQLWITQTYYADQFDTNDLSHQLAALFQMVGIIGLGIYSEHALDSSHVQFILSFMLVRSVIAFNYFRAGFHNEDVKNYTYNTVKAYILALMFWTLAILAPEEFRIHTLVLALSVDFIAPNLSFRDWMLSGEGEEGLFLADMSHITERIGLFLIIILGESMVAIVNGVSGSDGSTESQILGVASVFLMFSIWWIYFDVNERGKLYQQSFIKRQVSGSEKRWGYFQGLFSVQGTILVAGILTFIGVSLEHVIATENQHKLDHNELWLLAGSLSGFIFFVAISEFPTHLRLKRSVFISITTIRLAIFAIVLSIPILGFILTPIPLMMFLLVLMFSQIILTVFIQNKKPEERTIPSKI